MQPIARSSVALMTEAQELREQTLDAVPHSQLRSLRVRTKLERTTLPRISQIAVRPHVPPAPQRRRHLDGYAVRSLSATRSQEQRSRCRVREVILTARCVVDRVLPAARRASLETSELREKTAIVEKLYLPAVQ